MLKLRILALLIVVLSSAAFASRTSLKPARKPHPRVALKKPIITYKKPAIKMKNVFHALERYQIEVPIEVDEIKLDLSMADRGQTRWKGGRVTVVLGRAAFSSWAVLGSTLSHELEVHVKQNVSLIRFGDFFGLPTFKWAERQAYQHEINNARRFGLSQFEVRRIENTLRSVSL